MLEWSAGSSTRPAGIGTLRYTNDEPPSDNPAEYKAFRAYVAAEHTAPASVDALRAWVKGQPKI